MKNSIILFYCMVFASLSICMDNLVLLKTSDNKEVSLPQWKIESSRLLHIKHQWHLFKEKHDEVKPVGIILKTIDSNQLHLFSQALDAHNFPDYFNTLSSENKRLLISAAGQQELDSPILTSELVYSSLPSDLVNKKINVYLPISDIIHYLQRLIIVENCEQKKFTPLVVEDSDLYVRSKGSCYNTLPKILSKKTNFSGYTLPIVDQFLPQSSSRWLIKNLTNTAKGLLYFLTSIDPVDETKPYLQEKLKENRKKLWIKTKEGNQYREKIIQHTNGIKFAVFSNNGNYLATSSEGLQGELILTNLKQDSLENSDRFLNIPEGPIGYVCFNNKSNICATGIRGSVYFWNIETGHLLTKINIPLNLIAAIHFNKNDTRLATLSINLEKLNNIIMLWDIQDIDNITLIKTIYCNDLLVDNITFNVSGDKLIIGTKKSALVFNGLTGELIMDTGIINEQAEGLFAHVNAVLMPHDMNILVTQTLSYKNEISNKNICKVALWDINSGKCIGTLLDNGEHLFGVGVSAGGRYIIATTALLYERIQVSLYDDIMSNCLQWIDSKSHLIQKYFLLRLYRACKLNDTVHLHAASPEASVLQNLPVEPVNIKEFVEKYFIKKLV